MICATSPVGLVSGMRDQLQLPFRASHGGARRGSGRKRVPAEQRRTAHRSRGKHSKAHPVHVTLRSRSFKLREQAVIRTLLGALRDSNRDWFRVVHYSVQENHIHLVVEAEDAHRLSSSMRALVVRVARRVNRVLQRNGRFWADRWHGVTLTSPRQVRHVLVYVLQNRRKHAHGGGAQKLDPCSSAEWFDGFVEALPAGFRSIGPPATAPANSWLLRTGWQMRGKIRQCEVPSSH